MPYHVECHENSGHSALPEGQECDTCDHTFEEGDTYHEGRRLGPLCETCYDDLQVCEECNTILPPGCEFTADNDDGPFCESCYFETFSRCESCDREIDRRIEDLEYGHNDERICENCYESNPRGINNWDYTPELNYHGTSLNGHRIRFRRNDAPYIGFELEVENYRNRKSNTEMAEALVEQVGGDLIFCKDDGSLHNGFEIASHPFTWAWWVKNRGKFDSLFELLPKYGFRSSRTSTCGMHVHLTRTSFHTSQLYKIIKLVYDHQPWSEKIAQRQSTQYAAYTINGQERGEMRSLVAKAQPNSYDDQKYVAINTRSDRNTVEYRLFRGTLRKERFHKNIEFAYATYCYGKDASLKDINPQSFTEFVNKKWRSYRNLHSFMKERSL